MDGICLTPDIPKKKEHHTSQGILNFVTDKKVALMLSEFQTNDVARVWIHST